MIRQFWEEFVKWRKDSYKAGSNVTINEQLYEVHGKYGFWMHMPNQPAKYGFKIVMTCDLRTRYMLDTSPYTGKSTNIRTGFAEYFVKNLIEGN
jgi:hypothetical protein